jgi:hypothetical protein
MAAQPTTFGTIRGHLTQAAGSAEAAKAALHRLSTDKSISAADQQPIASAIGEAGEQIDKATKILDDAQADAIANASETITADFLKSSYEEAGHLERYYGTTRITASALLLTIAATIGVALLGAIHTIDAAENKQVIEYLRFGSIAIPIGIFAIMFYVNLYFEYWSNIANRVARYIEQLQILRMQAPESFVEIVGANGGHRAAAIRSVNRAQKTLWLQMISISVLAATLLAILSLIAWDVLRFYDVKGAIGSAKPFAEVWISFPFLLAGLLGFFIIGAIFLRVAKTDTVKPEQGGKEERWRKFIAACFPSRLPEIKNLGKPNWAATNLNDPVKLWAKNHVEKTNAGCAGRLSVLEANFAFVFFAAALYVAVAIGANAAPSVNPNKDAKKIEDALQDIATRLGPPTNEGSGTVSLSAAIAGIAGQLNGLSAAEGDNKVQLNAIAVQLKALNGRIEAVEKRLPSQSRQPQPSSRPRTGTPRQQQSPPGT